MTVSIDFVLSFTSLSTAYSTHPFSPLLPPEWGSSKSWCTVLPNQIQSLSANRPVIITWQVAEYIVTLSIWRDLHMTHGCKWGVSKTLGQRECYARPSVLLLAMFWSKRWAVGPRLSLWMLMNDVFKEETLPKVTLHYWAWCKRRLHTNGTVWRHQSTGLMQEQSFAQCKAFS